MVEIFRKIYERMGDELSRRIYIDRLNYSITQDACYLNEMVERTVRHQGGIWKAFLSLLQERSDAEELYLFGAGIWGRTLYEETKDRIAWKGVIDNRPDGKSMGNLDVMTLEQFKEVYDTNAVIVISSYKNGKEMAEQLQSANIPLDKIVDAGEVIHRLTEGAIYFDLQELEQGAAQEVFVDAGGFDGATCEGFMDWCGGNGYAYCFEADVSNIETARMRLAGYANCEIVPKALWSETTELSMHMKGSCGSSVTTRQEGHDIQSIEAVALDDLLGDQSVTFIKMDIEGAESEALRGACRIIREQHPKLAISIYHKKEDIWTLPGLILEYYPDYKLYLRHYSFAHYDTVLYAVP